MGLKRRACLLASLALVAAAAVSSTAYASTVYVSSGEINFDEVAGEANQVVVDRSGSNFTIADAGAPLSALFGCAAADANHATCPVAGITGISAEVGNLADTERVGDGVNGDLQIYLSGARVRG